MEKQLLRRQWILFFGVAAAGTLLHFAYRWSGGSPAVGVFAAVNESVWEHMKLLFVPLFVGVLLQSWAQGELYPNTLAAGAVSTALGVALIPMLYYTYSGALGKTWLAADAAIFYIVDAVACLLELHLLKQGKLSRPWQQLAGLLLLWGMLFAFVWCTFRPPALPLWQE